MIPYDLDPSLHAAEPEAATLDDGFSPPQHAIAEQSDAAPEPEPVPADPALWAKSPF
jgi:hypothetical protein